MALVREILEEESGILPPSHPPALGLGPRREGEAEPATCPRPRLRAEGDPPVRFRVGTWTVGARGLARQVLVPRRG